MLAWDALTVELSSKSFSLRPPSGQFWMIEARALAARSGECLLFFGKNDRPGFDKPRDQLAAVTFFR